MYVIREADSVYAFLTKKPTTVQDTPDSPTSTWAVQDAKDTAGRNRMGWNGMEWYRMEGREGEGRGCNVGICRESKRMEWD